MGKFKQPSNELVITNDVVKATHIGYRKTGNVNKTFPVFELFHHCIKCFLNSHYEFFS